MKIMPPVPGTGTDDTTLEDLNEIARLDVLSDEQREQVARDVQGQFDAVPSYLDRYKDGLVEE